MPGGQAQNDFRPVPGGECNAVRLSTRLAPNDLTRRFPGGVMRPGSRLETSVTRRKDFSVQCATRTVPASQPDERTGKHATRPQGEPERCDSAATLEGTCRASMSTRAAVMSTHDSGGKHFSPSGRHPQQAKFAARRGRMSPSINCFFIVA